MKYMKPGKNNKEDRLNFITNLRSKNCVILIDMSEIAMSTLWASAQSNQAISEHAQKLRNTLRTLVRSF